MEKIEEIRRQIKEKLPSLTRSQKIIADYMIEHPQKFALSSLQQLENELKVSKSTIVRMAQFLGYDGFYSLKADFLEEIKNSLEPIERYKKFLSTPHERIDFITLIAEETTKNIEKTLQLIDKTQYEKALELIKEAKHIYFIGMGISSCLAEIANYLFNRAAIKSTFMPYGALKFTEQIVAISRKSVVFAFSFPPYSRETINAARYAQSRGIKVISITDKITNEISRYSDACLQASVESITISNSIMSVLVILYALIAQLGNEFKAKSLKIIEALEKVRKEYE
ncbi:MAG: MurR/RpiR family transcriptional regulator [Candidatus Aminicenantes bacterium]|nr:MurR/RpiR family transcriptional regulator [Candidatus Aminicenantes bacterium]